MAYQKHLQGDLLCFRVCVCAWCGVVLLQTVGNQTALVFLCVWIVFVFVLLCACLRPISEQQEHCGKQT